MIVAAQTACKNPRPFRVNQLDFSDFCKLDKQQLASIPPGKIAGDPLVKMLSALKNRPDKTVHYKIFGEDQDWRLLPQRIAVTTDELD